MEPQELHNVGWRLRVSPSVLDYNTSAVAHNEPQPPSDRDLQLHSSGRSSRRDPGCNVKIRCLSLRTPRKTVTATKPPMTIVSYFVTGSSGIKPTRRVDYRMRYPPIKSRTTVRNNVRMPDRTLAAAGHRSTCLLSESTLRVCALPG